MGKGRKHPEAAVRMNFLHQAATCVLKSTGNKVLSAALGSHMVAVGQKSQVRVSKEIKRSICKVSSVSRKKRRNCFVKDKWKLSTIFLGMSPSSSTRPLF